MAETLISKKSPRLENETWKWYVYNTFSLVFNIKIKKNGSYLPDQTVQAGKIKVDFFTNTKGKELVKEFVFNNSNWEYTSATHVISIILSFDDAITSLFPVGKYSYCIKFEEHGTNNNTNTIEDVTTLYANGRAEVELCH